MYKHSRSFVETVQCMGFAILLIEKDILSNGRVLSYFNIKSESNIIQFIFPVSSIWWVVAFGLSVFLCVNIIYTLWLKWRENPVIISFDHKMLSISEIPFPATTICPIIKSRNDKFNYTHVYRLMHRLDENSSRAITETEY